MEHLRLGIIGTGIAARLLHWPALNELGDRYSVCGVANRTYAKAEDFAREIGLPPTGLFRDYRSLLEQQDIDAVLLAIPPKLNPSIAEEAFSCGKHVICEKPIAVTVDEAQGMIKAAARAGKKLLIAENFRYEKAVSVARQFLEHNAIGRPYLMLYKWMQHVPEDDLIAARPWRQDSGMPGGSFTDHGIHMVDAVRFLLGDIAEIQVSGSSFKEHLPGIDTALFNMKTSSGALCSIQWSFAVSGNDSWSAEIWGEKGVLGFDQDSVEINGDSGTERVTLKDRKSSFYYQFLDFHKAITEDSLAVMTASEAVKDLETMHAAFESVQSRYTVPLHHTGTLEGEIS